MGGDMAFNETSPQSVVDASIPQRSPILVVLLVLAAAFAVPRWTTTSHAQIMLPSDAQSSCDHLADIKNWFDRYRFVQPPDNEIFSDSSDDCIFLETSMRMFLWLTSIYRQPDGEPIYVYDSPLFYRVGLPDKRGYRRLRQNGAMRTPNGDDESARSFGPSISQLGPLNAPIIFDNQGRIHAFARHPILQNGSADPCGNDMPPAEIRSGASGARVSCPSGGYSTPSASVTGSRRSSGARVPASAGKPVSSIAVNGMTTYLHADGKVIVSTPGQVCNKILLSRDSKVVYYNIEVNDVYAYFLTGLRKKKIDFDTFPTGDDVTTATGTKTKDITEIKKVAKDHGTTLPDEKALAIEVKTAWIEIDDRDKERFVTTRAVVPTFNRANTKHWSADGWKNVQLGLVGMHIAFSAHSHQGMIWATFEHVDNVPNDEYQYCQDVGCEKVVTRWRDGSTDWLFSANDSLSASNQLAYLYKGDICAYNNSTIGPNNILRKHPWGSIFGLAFAPKRNTEIIKVNDNVLKSL
jgi:hypothetical protein